MAIILDGTNGITSPKYSGDVFNASLIKSSTSSPPTIQNTSGTEIGTFCRAWVNFRGLGTVSIDGAFNVSSITDGGIGTYTVNFTNPMPDINYAGIGACSTSGIQYNGWVLVSSYVNGKAVNSIGIVTLGPRSDTGTVFDAQSVYFAVFR